MKYFTEDELKCSHCGKSNIDKNFMAKVEVLREQLGFPFPVNSGYRCPEHPIEARKKAPGAHATGHAIDIGVSGKQAYDLVESAMKSGEFTGIGINQKGGSRFIHLDDIENSPERPRPWIWSY
jgi:zinc D-Ala-D-Ala carboxypeptidase